MLRFSKFINDLRAKGVYTKDFIKRMKEAEENVKNGKVKTYSAEEFLKSLS